MKNLDTVKRLLNQNSESVDAIRGYDCELFEKYKIGFINLGGPFASMNPATVLKEIDPLFWQGGLTDYLRRNSLVEANGKYYKVDDAEEIAADVAESLRNDSFITRRGSMNFEEKAVKLAEISYQIDCIQRYINPNLPET